MLMYHRANHQLGNKPFMCLFCQIAIGLVFDLGLNKDPVDGMNPFLCWKAAQERADREKNGSTAPASLFLKNQQPRTMEQRRAVLACYMVTSKYVSLALACASPRDFANRTQRRQLPW